MKIGARIRKRRESLGMSQEELAHKLGYKSRSTINKIEAGINDITQSKVYEFADALRTTPAYLMGWLEDPERLLEYDEEEGSRGAYVYAKYIEDILAVCERLNEHGRMKVFEYANDLAKSSCYAENAKLYYADKYGFVSEEGERISLAKLNSYQKQKRDYAHDLSKSPDYTDEYIIHRTAARGGGVKDEVMTREEYDAYVKKVKEMPDIHDPRL